MTRFRTMFRMRWYRWLMSIMLFFNGQVYPGVGIVNASNPDIKWERSEQVDLGFDLGLFNSMLTLEFDYFNRKTKDLLMILPIKGGFGGYYAYIFQCRFSP